VSPEDRLGRVGIDVAAFRRQAVADPGRLGRSFAFEDQRHEAAARDQADDQEPPLELGHQVRRVNEDIAGQSRPRSAPGGPTGKLRRP